MKQLCLSFFLAITLLPATLWAQTFTWVGPPAIEPSHGVAALSDTTAVFAAEDGKVYLGRTSSGSATFAGHFTLDFNTAFALNGQTAFAGGRYDETISESNLWRTDDGGANWLSMTAVAGEVVDVQFTDSLRGYALTNTALFLTTNGGISWTDQGVGASVSGGAMRLFYAANDTLWFIANNAGLYRSTGSGWTQVQNINFLIPPSSYELIPGGGGLTLQADGLLFHADDAALETFEDKSLNGWPSLTAFDWLDDNTAYGANGAALYRTTDGGDNWTQLDSARTPENALLSIAQLDAISPTVVYAIDGNDSAMWRTDNAFTVSRPALAELYVHVFPNPFADHLHITLPGKHRLETLQVVEMAGRVVDQEVIQPGQTSLKVSVGDLPAGVYLLQLQGDGQQIVRRVVKR